MGPIETIILSFLTLNIWGLPGVGKMGLAPFKNQRIVGICAELKKAAQSPTGWDAVLLQEVWLERDRKKLSRCGYPYRIDMNRAGMVVDSGLLILSKHPLQMPKRLTFPALPVGPDVLEDGEAIAKKSANLVKMIHPKVGEIFLANTHLVSYYAEGEQDKYKPIRKNQFIEFAEWVNQEVSNKPVVVGGDWNFGAHDPELWKEKEIRWHDFVVSAESEKYTTLSSENTFQEKDQGRVDHLFASPHFESVSGQLAMDKPVSIQNDLYNLSDHFGWTETFLVKVSNSLTHF